MILKIQIYSLVYSFLFGIIFYFLLDIFNRYNSNKIVVKIITSLLFIFITSIIYFVGLIYVNNGYLHIYFLLSILVGYLFIYFLIKMWFTYNKK